MCINYFVSHKIVENFKLPIVPGFIASITLLQLLIQLCVICEDILWSLIVLIFQAVKGVCNYLYIVFPSVTFQYYTPASSESHLSVLWSVYIKEGKISFIWHKISTYIVYIIVEQRKWHFLISKLQSSLHVKYSSLQLIGHFSPPQIWCFNSP